MGDKETRALDAALARWATGEADERTTDSALRSLLGTLDVAAIVVRLGPRDETLSAASERETPAARIAAAMVAGSPGQRGLVTRAESRWADLHAEGGDVGACAWIASEPMDTRHALVAIGGSPDSMNDALALLPRLARAFSALCAATEAGGDVQNEIHSLKNLLAGAIANVEYASFELEQLAATPADQTRTLPEDLSIALGNANESIKAMASHVDALQRLGLARGAGARRTKD